MKVSDTVIFTLAVPLFDAKTYGESHAAVPASSGGESEPMLPPTVSSHDVSRSAYSRSEYSQSSYTASTSQPTSPPVNAEFGSRLASGAPGYSYSITPYQPSASASASVTSLPSLVASGASTPPAVGAASRTTRPTRKAEEAGLLSVPRNTTYHADSGIRFGATGSQQASGSGSQPEDHAGTPTDVPPSYTPN